jgi:hypothetical protein
MIDYQNEIINLIIGETLEEKFHFLSKIMKPWKEKKNRKWNKTEDKILCENWSTKNIYQIISLIPNRSKKSIQKRAYKLKLRKESNYIKSARRATTMFKDDFVKKSIDLYGDIYDYSDIIYINSTEKVSIKCNKHGYFFQLPYKHIRGYGCHKCHIEKTTLTQNEFIERVSVIHMNKYDYSLVEYKNIRTKIKIICNKHGEFIQNPQTHLEGHGCPSCKNSRNENTIEKFLVFNNIEFIKEKTFEECKFKGKLRFDFYLPKQNICIEYDGKQHHESIEYYGGAEKLKVTKLRDDIKNKFCSENNINLIRINYKDDTYKKLLEHFTGSKINEEMVTFTKKSRKQK